MSPRADLRFPRSARLLKSKEFRFDRLRRFDGGSLFFYYTPEGKGRLGISISKRVLRDACDRNRAKRLIREVFRVRRGRLASVDVHVVGRSPITQAIERLGEKEVASIFDAWMQHL